MSSTIFTIIYNKVLPFFITTKLYSIKDSRNILISVNYTINLYIFVSDLIDNHIIFPYRIFIICPKADSFKKIGSHSRKHLKIFKFTVDFLYGLCCIFFIILSNVIPDVLQILCNNRIDPQF